MNIHCRPVGTDKVSINNGPPINISDLGLLINVNTGALLAIGSVNDPTSTVMIGMRTRTPGDWLVTPYPALEQRNICYIVDVLTTKDEALRRKVNNTNLAGMLVKELARNADMAEFMQNVKQHYKLEPVRVIPIGKTHRIEFIDDLGNYRIMRSSGSDATDKYDNAVVSALIDMLTHSPQIEDRDGRKTLVVNPADVDRILLTDGKTASELILMKDGKPPFRFK